MNIHFSSKGITFFLPFPHSNACLFPFFSLHESKQSALWFEPFRVRFLFTRTHDAFTAHARNGVDQFPTFVQAYNVVASAD